MKLTSLPDRRPVPPPAPSRGGGGAGTRTHPGKHTSRGRTPRRRGGKREAAAEARSRGVLSPARWGAGGCAGWLAGAVGGARGGE